MTMRMDGGFDKKTSFMPGMFNKDPLGLFKSNQGRQWVKMAYRLRRNSLWALRCAHWRVRVVVVKL